MRVARTITLGLALLLASACQEDAGVIVDIDGDGGFVRHDAGHDGGDEDDDDGGEDDDDGGDQKSP